MFWLYEKINKKKINNKVESAHIYTNDKMKIFIYVELEVLNFCYKVHHIFFNFFFVTITLHI